MFDNQNARNKPSSKNSSSAKQFQLQRGIQLQDLEVERESFAKISQDEKPFLEKSSGCDICVVKCLTLRRNYCSIVLQK